VCATLSVWWTLVPDSIKSAWQLVQQIPILCWSMINLLLKKALSSILQNQMLVKNTLITYNFQRQVWAYLCQAHLISKECQINSLLLFGFYLRNWIQSHSLLTSLIEVISGVNQQIWECFTSLWPGPMRIQTSCRQSMTHLRMTTRYHWTSGPTLLWVKGRSKLKQACIIKFN
jgi:hypothetical protein